MTGLLSHRRLVMLDETCLVEVAHLLTGALVIA